ncbi:hypothetical protein F5B18DRAFT_619983 [Nemania serpens]|nr:hypothetical protein F5B18DRAFT_619983 [Nemania serpens]
MNSYTPQMPTPKLKDSCDPCSASKLRCDKQKPTCTRCAGLKQPCYYSPARRAGRPHRVRLDRSQVVETGARGGTISNSIRAKESRYNGQQQREQSQLAKIPAFSTPYPNAGEDDCTRIAISILKELNPPPSGHNPSVTNLTTTEACEQLLTILVCPCSEQPGVALLVASGCISLMDMVYHPSHDYSTQDQSSLNMWNNTSTDPFTESSSMMWAMPSSSKHTIANQPPYGVEDLAKIAKVISQFTDKYCQEPKHGSGLPFTNWLVTPILPLLRLRLQAVTREAARRLVI